MHFIMLHAIPQSLKEHSNNIHKSCVNCTMLQVYNIVIVVRQFSRVQTTG